MSFTVKFGEEQLAFEVEVGSSSVSAEAIAEVIRKEKNVLKGCISRTGNIVMRVTSCSANGTYIFVNYEAAPGKPVH